ncbi:MAG: hypothetical protein PUC32_02225 [Oscillospiraceae bacterium]|nr:hypothetical protein [Oscillospiraceae bacterium]
MKLSCKGIGKCYCKSQFAVTFGLGLVIACFCPMKVTLFLAGVIIAALGIAVVRRHH